jgi:hypothetical protein
MCVPTCNGSRYYRNPLTPEQATLTGDLEVGSEVCVPCDELCNGECNGPGHLLEPYGCLECRYSREGSECTSQCNNSGVFA